MELLMRGCLPILLNQMRWTKEKNRTLTNLVNAMLDTAVVSKTWWGEAILTACVFLLRTKIRHHSRNGKRNNCHFLTYGLGIVWQR
jgi:hypothetical protein